MANAIPTIEIPTNEPVCGYAPGSPERASLQQRLEEMAAQPIEIPLLIGGEEVKTGKTVEVRAPHDHSLVLAHVHQGGEEEMRAAIEAAKGAWSAWSEAPWYQRASVFLKAAELLAGPRRDDHNAATMLGQSKNVFQAEIDAACELIDFWRFNGYYANKLYADQPPVSPEGVWNRSELRALEGWVFAITPFNFSSIGANLVSAPALMGNVVVWKPAPTQMLSAWYAMDILREAGLPAGVINMVTGDPAEIGGVGLTDPDLAGVHFTGSTQTFQHIYRTIGENIASYRSYPRIVGETGGKDFVVAHPSADPDALITALTRGSFEFQGQKCSAASRAYVPESLWETVRAGMVRDAEAITLGDPRDFSHLCCAVIDERAFTKITGYIDRAKASPDAEIVLGGTYDRTTGWFVHPTVIRALKPDYESMREEIFGPVLTVYVYPDAEFAETLALCDRTSPYALTGAIFARDRHVVEQAERALRHSAGNFYINDKPTGAVVGQQPFGGARASGTNDKAGSWLNLMRWASPRSIKETLNPPKDFRYPHMG